MRRKKPEQEVVVEYVHQHYGQRSSEIQRARHFGKITSDFGGVKITGRDGIAVYSNSVVVRVLGGSEANPATPIDKKAARSA